MSNSWFQFRRFRISQDRCAMKVSTDACIQGAWAPLGENVKTVLDIGTGTGLLALMLAQRFPQIHVRAVELDEAAAVQAAENAAASPWADRIAVEQRDVRTFHSPQPFDFIISNPPFFNRSLKSPDAKRTLARHSDTLDQENLLAAIARLLRSGGTSCILLPAAEHERWKQLSFAAGWQLRQELQIRDREEKPVGRVVSLWDRGPAAAQTTSLVVRDSAGAYTASFTALLSPFYLHL